MSKETELHERVARVEQKLEQLDDIEDKLDTIERDLVRYRGLIGGVLLVVTAVGTLLKLAWGYIESHWSW